MGQSLKCAAACALILCVSGIVVGQTTVATENAARSASDQMTYEQLLRIVCSRESPNDDFENLAAMLAKPIGRSNPQEVTALTDLLVKLRDAPMPADPGKAQQEELLRDERIVKVVELLENYGSAAEPALDDLVATYAKFRLRSKYDVVPVTIGNIAGAMQEREMASSFLQSSSVRESIKKLDSVLDRLRPIVPEGELRPITRARNTIDAAYRQFLWVRVDEYCRSHPWTIRVALAVIILSIYALLLLIFSHFWPELIVRLDDMLGGVQVAVNKIPWLRSLPIDVSIPARYLTLVGFCAAHPYVLDAWVRRRLANVRRNFALTPTVSYNPIQVPVPVRLDNVWRDPLRAEHLTDWASHNGAIVISGDAGTGKTNLGCRIAWWALGKGAPEDHTSTNQFGKPDMIPILLENDLSIPDAAAANALPRALLREISRGLMSITGESRRISGVMTSRLLRARRILVIADRLSELNDGMPGGEQDEGCHLRRAILLNSPICPLTALIVTSRDADELESAPHVSIRVEPPRGKAIAAFLEDYLKQREQLAIARNEEHAAGAGTVQNQEFKELYERVEALSENGDVPIGLLRLFAELLYARKNDPGSVQLSDTVQSLVLRSLEMFNVGTIAGNAVNQMDFRHDVQRIAWECILAVPRYGEAKKSDVIAALASVQWGENPTAKPQDRLDYLLELKIIQPAGADLTRVRFTGQIFSEYLAATFFCSADAKEMSPLWDRLIERVDEMPDSPPLPERLFATFAECGKNTGLAGQYLKWFQESGSRGGATQSQSRARRRRNVSASTN